MHDRVEDFFIPDNVIKHPDALDYSKVDAYIRSAEAFSRTTYQSVYIIDYARQNFLYVSPNQVFLADLSPDEMKRIGYRFYLDYVPEDERDLLLSLNKAGFSYYNSLPVEERWEWYITYDFHILTGDRKVLVTHKLTPLALTDDGEIWLALCVVSASNHTTSGHVEVHKSGSPEYYEYNPATRRWIERRMPQLSETEKSIITLSMQGYTMAEIADKICLSAETIKKYRQRIFEKLGVRNIAEAIVTATNSKLI